MSLLLDCSYPWGPNLWVSKRCMLVAVGQHTQDKARQGLKDFTGKDVTRHGFRQLFTHWKEDSPRPPCLHTQEDYPEMKGNEWLMLWCSPWLEMWECSWVISAALFQGSQGREPHSYHGPGVIRICLMPAHPGSQTNNGRWPHGSVQSFSRVWLFATPWTAAYQASLSITISQSLLQHHSSKATVLRCSAFFTVQLSRSYMTTGKNIALTIQSFVDTVMSLLFNMLSRLVISFLSRSKHLLISWLQYHLEWFWSPEK